MQHAPKAASMVGLLHQPAKRKHFMVVCGIRPRFMAPGQGPISADFPL